MDDLSPVSTRHLSRDSSSATWKAPGLIALMLAAPFALAGCNSSQGLDLSSQDAPMNTAGRFVSTDNPYNPIKYAQTSGFYFGH
jgi:hypothetical protein